MTNNRYLFRGKRLSNDEWVEGFYYEHQPPLQCFAGEKEKSQHCILKTGFADWNMPRPTDMYEIDINTLGQCTGEKDKNEKLIFEGDSVKPVRNITDDKGNVLIRSGQIAQIEFEDGVFWANVQHGGIASFSDSGFDTRFVEIVGNIHDKNK